LLTFHLRDEISSEGSHNGLQVNHEEQDAIILGATSLAPARAEREVEPTPETSPEPALRRVKHMVQKRKFGA